MTVRRRPATSRGARREPRRYVAAAMEIERIEEGQRLRLALTGELDLYTAPAFDDALVEAEGESWPLLVIDLSSLEFLDSAGLRLVVRSHARAEQSGRR